MDGCVFSLAAEGDLSEVLDLYRGLIGTPGCTWSQDYPTGEDIAEDIAAGSLYTLRDCGGQIIAAAAAGAGDELDGLPWQAKNPCDLARVGVLAAWQNRGLGTALLKHVTRAVEERGFDGIRMLVSKGNAPALALYEKNGFQRCGETVMYGIHFFCYEKLLPRRG